MEKTEVALKTPAEKKEQAKQNRIAAMARARAAKKAKVSHETVLSETSIKADIGIADTSTKPLLNSKEIVYFGEVDINKKTGLPASDYPAWCHDPQIEELKDEIRASEKAIDLELYKGKDLMRMREQLSMKKKRLDQILDSKPKINDADKDRIARARKDLGERIGESMFTASDMMRGTADAHVEAERMVKPCVKIQSEYEAGLAKACGMNIENGKVSRNDAARIWKIQGKLLGESILDAEQLRNQS
jgi:hypothetical protein